MNKSSVDFWVGTFVALGLTALLFLALKAGNLSAISFSSTYSVSARFENIGGLKLRAPVKSAGVVVGRVAKVNFDDKTYQATVTLALDPHYHFPKDSSARVLTSGLLGEQYIGLEAGGDSDNLVEGDVIDTTQSAIVLENLLGQLLFNKAAEAGTTKAAETKQK